MATMSQYTYIKKTFSFVNTSKIVLQTITPFHHFNMHEYPKRQKNKLYIVNFKPGKYKCSSVSTGSKIFNKLPLNI